MIAEAAVCTDLARKSGEGVDCGNVHSTHSSLFRHFTAFAKLYSLLFLVVSFQDLLTLEDPVKVVKVGL